MIPDQLSFAKFWTWQVVKPKIQVQPTTPNFWFSQKPTQKPEKFDFSNIVSTVKNVFWWEAEQNKPTTYTWRNESVMELQKWIEQANKETHKLNTLMDMKRYYDDWASFDEIKNDFKDVPQEIIWQLYDEFNLWTKFKDILKLYPELDNIQVPQELSNKYDIKKYFNPLWEVGKTILEAKQKSKKEWSFLTSNPLTQWFMWAIWWAVKWAWDLGAGIVWLSDTINAWAKSATQWWNIDQYKERPTTTSEDALNIFWWGTTTVWSVFALPAITLINAGIETLPQDQQVALSDSMDWLWDKIAQTPWLKQWMQSLPPDRQSEFKQELANAWVWLLLWLKNKKNIVTDPRTFLKENINPIDIAKNFNENVLWFASKVKDIPSTIKEWSKKAWWFLPSAEKVIQNMNRLTKWEQEKFQKMTWKSQWEWMNERGIISWWEKVINDLSDRFIESKRQADLWLEAIKWTYKNSFLTLMADESAKFADDTLSPEASRIKELADKANNEWLTMTEINEIKRFYEKNNKFTYGRDITAWEKMQRATNIDNSVRDRQFKVAEENWFTNLKEINKETQASKFILDKLVKNENWRLWNNFMTLTDWIAWAWLASVDPHAITLLAWKKLASMPWFKEKYINIINKINWHKSIERKIADIENITKIQTKKDLDNFLALPYKDNIWETPNTILPWGKKIIAWSNGNMREWQILEINNKKNESNNSYSDNISNDIRNLDNSRKARWEIFKEKDWWSEQALWQGEKTTWEIWGWTLWVDQTNVRKWKVWTTPKKVITKDDSIVKKEGNLINNTLWDNTPTTVKKKPVQSDTLVSEADIMEADRLTNAQYIKEDVISNLQSIAKKNPESIRKVLQKDWVPDNRIQSFIDDASNGKISERQAKNVSDALVSKSDSMKTPYSNSFDAYKAIWDDARATKAFERAQLPTSEIKAKYKDGTLTKQDVQDIIYAKEQDAQSQYIYERSIKRKIDRWWRNENDIILSLKNMITDNVNTKPKNILAPKSKELQSLYDEAKKYKSADEFIDSKKSKPINEKEYTEKMKKQWASDYAIEKRKHLASDESIWERFAINDIPNNYEVISVEKLKEWEIPMTKINKENRIDDVYEVDSVLGIWSDWRKKVVLRQVQDESQLNQIREEANTAWKKELWPLSSKPEVKAQSLLEEARKYKTAEEFINSNSKVYHWTNAERDVFDINKWFRQQYWKAFYWTLIKDKASNYWKVKDIYLDKDIKLFQWSNIKSSKPYIYNDSDISKYFKDNNFNSEEKISYLKSKWYDWLIAWDEHVIFNTDKIKTEAQLRKIREEANK